MWKEMIIDYSKPGKTALPYGSAPALWWEWHIPSSFFNRGALLAILPMILAANILEKSTNLHSLPEEEAYRSPLSETILKSNPWRASKKPEALDWRLPSQPQVGWRTPQSSQSDISSSNRTIEIFPRYQSGKPSDYDFIEREEKPLIKMFEFGSK
jgi:hypothetical protein